MKTALTCMIATILSLASILPAVAAQEEERKVWNPPAEYDVPYTGHLTLFQVPQRQVVKLCKQLYKNNNASIPVTPTQKGCAWQFNGSCVAIAIDREYRGVLPKNVVRHLVGRCNGWSPEQASPS